MRMTRSAGRPQPASSWLSNSGREFAVGIVRKSNSRSKRFAGGLTLQQSDPNSCGLSVRASIAPPLGRLT